MLELKPLFAEWLQEEAIEHTKKGTKMALVYNRALDKLRKYPSEINTPKDLRSVQYIGDKTVKLLTAKLNKHCTANNIAFPTAFNPDPVQLNRDVDAPAVKKRKTSTKEWIPKRRTGSWAILVAIFLKDVTRKGLRKDEIIAKAVPHCDTPFTANPAANDYYSAWGGMKTLIKREYVFVSSTSPKLYYISDEGISVAKVITEQENIQRSPERAEVESSFDNGVVLTLPLSDRLFVTSSPSQRKHDHANRTFDGIPYDVWPHEEYTIFPVIDSREIRSQKERDFFLTRLEVHDIQCDVRSLSLGDIVWIAKHNVSGQEVVLDVICERKRMDDLASSIRDGRYQEQKSRLKRSGMSYIYYIVEQSTSDFEMVEAIQTSISMTMTVSNFFIRKFKNTEATISFIASLTKVLQSYYKENRIRIIALKPRSIANKEEFRAQLDLFRAKFEFKSSNFKCCQRFPLFQDAMPKTGMMTVKEMFVLMLMTVKGISFDKAVVIQRYFSTPRNLLEYFLSHRNEPIEDQKLLMFNLFKGEIGNKKLNKVALANIFETWAPDQEGHKENL